MVRWSLVSRAGDLLSERTRRPQRDATVRRVLVATQPPTSVKRVGGQVHTYRPVYDCTQEQSGITANKCPEHDADPTYTHCTYTYLVLTKCAQDLPVKGGV